MRRVGRGPLLLAGVALLALPVAAVLCALLLLPPVYAGIFYRDGEPARAAALGVAWLLALYLVVIRRGGLEPRG
jgi:hypothetical protein